MLKQHFFKDIKQSCYVLYLRLYVVLQKLNLNNTKKIILYNFIQCSSLKLSQKSEKL